MRKKKSDDKIPLFVLIKSLNRKEVEYVNSYFSSEKVDSNIRKLFGYLHKAKEYPGRDFLSKKIYKKPKDNTIDKLHSRLFSKITDLMVSYGYKENRNMEHLENISVTLRKKFVQLLNRYYSKGVYDAVSKHLLSEIITTAIQYEFYTPLLEALHFKKHIKGFSSGLKEFNKIQDQIDFYTKCMLANYKALDYYSKLSISFNFNIYSYNEVNDFLKSAIKELEEDYKFTSSSNIGYFLMRLRLNYYLNIGNYKKHKEVSYQLIELLKNSKAVFSNKRIAFVLIELAQSEIHLREYQDTVKHAREASQFIPKGSINFFVSKEVEFFGYFYSNRIEEAKELLMPIQSSLLLAERDPFRFSKFQFYLAITLFKAGDFKSAKTIIGRGTNFSIEPVWEVAVRILFIWCLIELRQFETAIEQIRRIRKYVGLGISKKVESGQHSDSPVDKRKINKRDKVFCNYLYSLSQNKFDFKKNNTEKTIQMLSNKQGSIAWDHLTPELIPYQDWIREKAGLSEQFVEEEGKVNQ